VNSQAHNEIADYDVYNRAMDRSMMDKMFFADKVEADLIVDFGCASGSLIRHLAGWYPAATFVGFDVDPKMCAEAVKSSVELTTRVSFASQWADVEAKVHGFKAEHRKTALVLNSVIHEVYAYSEVRDVDAFWARVFNSGFDFIVIRDMVPSETVDRAADPNDIAKILRRFRNSRELRDFQTRYGSIASNKNLVHFLLKYRYTTPNWEREVKENYIPIYAEDLLAMLPKEYAILYQEHYPLPFLKRQIRTDFGIELKDPTHFKLILEAI
jgi:SAM-dependent methyltransferase